MKNAIEQSTRRIPVIVLCSLVLCFATQCAGYAPTATATLAPTPRPTIPLAPISLPAPTATRPPTPTPIPPDAADKIERNVTYCTVDGTALKLDLYFPKKSDGRALPVAVNVHGGSWRAGDKARSDTAADIPDLLERGYLVAAVNYRLAPADKFPAQIEDVKCAVRFLRAHAATYHLDPDRIGAWGCSAGGHLVALLGVTDPSAEFEGAGNYREQSSRVRAVATISAPTDITLYNTITRANMLAEVFGTTVHNDPLLARASPVNYVTSNDPPFLIIQAEKDSLVSAEHGQELFARLKQKGIDANLVTVKNGDHCLLSTDVPTTPTRAEISKLIADFFDVKMN